jgi:type VI secretion system protein ImpK
MAPVEPVASPKAAQATSAAPAAPATPSAPAAADAATALTAALAGLPVVVSRDAGGVMVALRDHSQFASGSTRPSPRASALVQKVAAALDRLPGRILVIGHADAMLPRHGTNAELSAARARAVATIMAKALADPKRLATEGRSDAEPIAPNDSDSNRAKNRRVAIQLRGTR